MKKQTITIILLAVILGVILFLLSSGYLFDSYINANSENNSEQTTSDVGSIYNSPNVFLNFVRSEKQLLTDEQIQEQLDELKSLENMNAGTFSRKHQEIQGYYNKDFQRIDLKTAKEIENGKANIPLFTPADYIGGSGLSRIEFWLDNDGNKMLISLIKITDTTMSFNNFYLITSYRISSLSSLYNPKRELKEDELKGLSKEQISKLKLIREEGNRYAGIYSRQEAVIKGLIDEDSTRLDVSTVKDIVLNSSGFDEILSKIKAAVPYPDYIGGSGDSRIEYKLPNSDYDKIVILTQYEEIVLFQNTSPAVETLYQGQKDIETEKNCYNLDRELNEEDIKGLIQEQVVKLKDVRGKGFEKTGIFYRQEAIIKGLVAENSTKLDAATAKEIIANSSSFKEIIEKFYTVQYYPDFAGGSGHARIEYWLDDNGTEKICIYIISESIMLTKNSEVEILYNASFNKLTESR